MAEVIDPNATPELDGDRVVFCNAEKPKTAVRFVPTDNFQPKIGDWCQNAIGQFYQVFCDWEPCDPRMTVYRREEYDPTEDQAKIDTLEAAVKNHVDVLGATQKVLRERGEAINSLRATHIETLKALKALFKKTSDERLKFLDDHEAEARKFKTEGDMYGWNFHMGMSAGANQTDILYHRIDRAIDMAIAMAKKEVPDGR